MVRDFIPFFVASGAGPADSDNKKQPRVSRGCIFPRLLGSLS